VRQKDKSRQASYFWTVPKPVLFADPGTQILFETWDALQGQIKKRAKTARIEKQKPVAKT